MSATIQRALTAGLWASVIAAIASAGGSMLARQQAPYTSLSVNGAASSAPSLAALDRTVVAVWAASRNGAANVFAAVSQDAGATFSEPRRVNDQDGDASVNSEQPPRVVVSGPVAARVVTVVWSKRNDGSQRSREDVVRVARSTDGGRTFSPARTIHDSTLSGARGWESLATGQSGAVHAVWLDGRDATRKMAEAAHSGMPHKGLPPQDVYHGILTPDGRRVETVIATGVCFCCKTAVAVDVRGTVYAAWRHIFPGSMRDIAFARSTDGGAHFDPLVRVSEDKWELNGCPEDGPALAVDRSGVIHVAWATLVNEGDEPRKAVFYATSRDGKTFSPRNRLPTAGITPGHPQMTLTTDGGAVIAWDETVDRVHRIAMVRASASRPVGPPQVLSGTESASHPVLVQSGGGLVVAWADRDASVIRVRRVAMTK